MSACIDKIKSELGREPTAVDYIVLGQLSRALLLVLRFSRRSFDRTMAKDGTPRQHVEALRSWSRLCLDLSARLKPRERDGAEPPPLRFTDADGEVIE